MKGENKMGGRGASGKGKSGGGGGGGVSTSIPKKFKVQSKTFKVEMVNGVPTVKISMYDTMKRQNELEKKASVYGIKVKYTH